MDREHRRELVARRLGVAVPDARGLLITHPPNVRYLSGFTGSSGWLLMRSGGDALLLTDGRYAEQAAREAGSSGGGLDVVSVAGAGFVRAASQHEIRPLAVESTMPVATFRELRRVAGADEVVVVADAVVEDVRRVKDPDEIAALARAQRCADEAFAAIVDLLRPGTTERTIALELEVTMRERGADDRAFPPIVAFGEHASEPHHAPTGRELALGDVVKLDFGARVDGYHSDMTRTVAVGEPGPELRRIYATVADAHRTGIDALRVGVEARVVEAAARAVVEDAGYAQGWVHPLGHGVGLEIHEAPILRSQERSTIPAGGVITIEPGVYVPGLGGVRIEDMVEVGEEGPRPMPSTPTDLLVL